MLSTIKAQIVNVGATSYVIESNKDGFKAGTSFQCFHYQAQTHISNRGLIAGYLMIWLKQCVVLYVYQDAIAIEIVYPTVLLTDGRPLRLLSTMVCKLLNGL